MRDHTRPSGDASAVLGENQVIELERRGDVSMD